MNYTTYVILFLACLGQGIANLVGIDQFSSPILPESYFTDFKEVSKLVDISYCITPGSKIRFPFECHGECSEFPNTTLIHQFTGDNSLQTLTVTGYIAIDHKKELIYLSLRGTRSFSDLLTDIDSLQIPINHICLNCKIHKGFFETFDNTLLKIDEYLIQLTNNYPQYRMLIMGHSLGGAIATLISYHVYDKLKFTNFKCITMGQPTLGNEWLSFYLKELLNTDASDLSRRFFYRITNKGDAVPNLPISSSNGDIYEQLSGEIFISNLDLNSLNPNDVVVCRGNDDFNCIKNLYGSSFNSHLIYFKKLGYCGYGF